MLPFTREEFLSVFASYNEAIWPSQIVAYIIAAVAVAAVSRPSTNSDRIVVAVLAAMWIGTGAAYHWLFFLQINKAALAFGLVFIVQGILLAYIGLVQNRLQFWFADGIAGVVGAGFVTYAAIFYPLISWISGHAYPTMPMFGVTPCPVTIFTLGLFLFSKGRLPLLLLIVPVIWSLIGGSAAILLDVPQDWLLLISGPVAGLLLVLRNRRYATGGITISGGRRSRRTDTRKRRWWTRSST